MKVAGHTYAFRDRPLGAALDELASLGFSLVEIWVGHARDGPDPVVRALRGRDLEAAAVSAGGIYAADSDVFGRAFSLAEAVDAPVVVASIPPAILGSLAGRVPAHITLCVENHWDQPLATGEEVRDTLAVHPSLAACADTGHAILAGETPEAFVAALGARVGHVHLKDAAMPPLHERLMGRRLRARLLPRPAPVVPGTGALDVGRVRAALAAAGFEGTVALEHEGPEPAAALGRLLALWTESGEADARG